ncbi:MAG: NfeD family protein [Cytophagales bacterium]
MDWLIVILLMVLGLFLVLVEIFLIPGVTIAGIFGILSEVLSVSMAYNNFGRETGNLFLVVAVILNLFALYLAFKSGFWEKFALKKNMEEKVNEQKLSNITVGMVGVTSSVLRPMGKAIFDGVKVEVSSLGDWIEKDTQVRVLSVDGKKVMVEKIG